MGNKLGNLGPIRWLKIDLLGRPVPFLLISTNASRASCFPSTAYTPKQDFMSNFGHNRDDSSPLNLRVGYFPREDKFVRLSRSASSFSGSKIGLTSLTNFEYELIPQVMTLGDLLLWEKPTDPTGMVLIS